VAKGLVSGLSLLIVHYKVCNVNSFTVVGGIHDATETKIKQKKPTPQLGSQPLSINCSFNPCFLTSQTLPEKTADVSFKYPFQITII